MKYYRKYTWIIVLCGLLGLFIPTQVGLRAQQDNTPDATLVNQLSLRKTTVESIKAVGTEISIFNRSAELKAGIAEEIHREFLDLPTTLTQTQWIGEGNQSRAEKCVLFTEEKDTSRENYTLSASNEDSLQVWEWGEPSATQMYTGEITEAIQSLSQWMQVSLDREVSLPILDPLLSGEAKFVNEEVLGEVATRLYEFSSNGEMNRWWVSPSFGFVVKHERSSIKSTSPSVAKWRHVMIVDKAQKINDLWIPRQVRHFNVVTLQNGKEYWENVIRIDIAELQINEPITNTSLQLPLPLQTFIVSEEEPLKIVGGNIDESRKMYRQLRTAENFPDELFSEIPLNRQNN